MCGEAWNHNLKYLPLNDNDNDNAPGKSTCSNFECDSNRVTMQSKINPFCLTTSDLFNNIIITSIKPIFITYSIVICLYLLQELKFFAKIKKCIIGRKQKNAKNNIQSSLTDPEFTFKSFRRTKDIR